MAVLVGCWPNANAADISRPAPFLSFFPRLFFFGRAPCQAPCGPMRPHAAPCNPMRPHAAPAAAPCGPTHHTPGFSAGTPGHRDRRQEAGRHERPPASQGPCTSTARHRHRHAGTGLLVARGTGQTVRFRVRPHSRDHRTPRRPAPRSCSTAKLAHAQVQLITSY
jgi:hypothetical protein